MHDPHGDAIGEKQSEGVDLHDAIPRLRRALVQSAIAKLATTDSGDVQQKYPDGPPALPPPRRTADRLLRGQSEIDRQVPARAKRDELIEFGTIETRCSARHDHVSPFLEEPPCRRQTDTAGPPDDQAGPSLEPARSWHEQTPIGEQVRRVNNSILDLENHLDRLQPVRDVKN